MENFILLMMVDTYSLYSCWPSVTSLFALALRARLIISRPARRSDAAAALMDR